MEEIRRVYRALGSYCQVAVGGGQGQSFDFDVVEFAENYQLNVARTYSALRLLEQAGWIVLTDAVFHPASLMIRVSKDELYDYQLRHPRLDQVLKAVLRNYQGAFSQHLHLREAQLARLLNLSKDDLRRAFTRLQQDGVVDYQPQRDRPQLIFLHERVDADNLTIDQQLYFFRKNRHRERLRAALAYAETPLCRSQQLLAYFGEKKSEPCGVCDVCTGRNRADLNAESFDRLRDKVRQVLHREPLTLEQTVESFSPKWRERVLQTLNVLLDEGVIGKVEDKLIWQENRRREN
jgi:ATP-dependent DNA helicase RecQ